MYCIIFHTMLYIPVLLLLNKHSFIHFESSDDEEITELVIDEEVPDHEIDYYFSSSDDEP